MRHNRREQKILDSFKIQIQSDKPSCKGGTLKLTQEKFNQLYGQLGQPKKYGILLGQALFQGEIGLFFEKARSVSENNGVTLHVSLCVQTTDSELRKLRWERLCIRYPGDRWDFLAHDNRLPFSMAIESEITRRFQKPKNLRALVLVASPEPGRYAGLSQFNVEQTVSDVQKALGEIECDVLANMTDAIGPPTLINPNRQVLTT